METRGLHRQAQAGLLLALGNRISLRGRLFLILLLTAGLAVITTQAISHWVLLHNLKGLIEARNAERIERIQERLLDYHAQDPGWQRLRNNPSLLERLFRQAPPGRHAGRHGELAFVLLDADDRLLFANTAVPRPRLQAQGLVLDGKRIATLLVAPALLPDPAQQRFRQQQSLHVWLIALVAVALSALLAFPAATLLARPVRRLQAATRKLTAGDYSTRLSPSTRDELGQLAEDLNRLAATLEENERARQRWVADTAHELRTPVALLQAQVEAMQDGIRPSNASTLKQLHDDILRLGRLVGDLKELTMTAPGGLRYRMQPLDLDALVSTAMEEFRDRFRERGLMLELNAEGDGPWRLPGDADRLRQLLRNLLANSLAHTHAGGRVQLTLSRDGTATDGARLCLAVDDTEPGVTDAALPRLFDRLYREEASRSRDTGGAGLGLAIARNIVLAHGGSLHAVHSPLGGLGIRIHLPADGSGERP